MILSLASQACRDRARKAREDGGKDRIRNEAAWNNAARALASHVMAWNVAHAIKSPGKPGAGGDF